MKTERWFRRFTRHSLPRLVWQTLLIYLIIALLALLLLLFVATSETYRPLSLLYGVVVLLVMMILMARYTSQVQHGEAYHRQLIEQATDGIFVCDQAGHFLDANPAGCTLLDYTREELLHRKISDIVHPEDRAAVAFQLEQIRLGQTALGVRRLLSKTGQLFIAEIKARSIEPNRVIAIVRDVTARHEMETTLRTSEAQLRAC